MLFNDCWIIIFTSKNNNSWKLVFYLINENFISILIIVQSDS